MKALSMALGVALAVLSCAMDAKSQTMMGSQGNTMMGTQGQFGVQMPVQGPAREPAQVSRAASRDDLLRHCRQQVFRKYGQRAGSQTLVRTDNMLQMTDACVANGGVLN